MERQFYPIVSVTRWSLLIHAKVGSMSTAPISRFTRGPYAGYKQKNNLFILMKKVVLYKIWIIIENINHK
jgi:hypothetical protein